MVEVEVIFEGHNNLLYSFRLFFSFIKQGFFLGEEGVETLNMLEKSSPKPILKYFYGNEGKKISIYFELLKQILLIKYFYYKTAVIKINII